MRRIFTLLVVLGALCAGTVEAQVLQKAGAKQVLTTAARRAITVGDNQSWWGYGIGNTSMGMVGVKSADTYHCAIFLPGNHAVAQGKKLCAMRFGLLAEHASNVKAWVASTLPAGDPTASNTLCMKDVDYAPATTIEVTFDTPVDIAADGVYVGYSFTITTATTNYDQYPVLYTGEEQPHALLLRTSNAVKEWGDLYGQSFGALALDVLLEGTFSQNSVTPSFATASFYAQTGQSADVEVVLANNSPVAVSSVSYTIDGGSEQTATLSRPITAWAKGSTTISVPADALVGSSQKTLAVTKVNGQANESQTASATFTLVTVDRLIQRNVVVEEFTGTGCGYCPRGLAGMEKLRETFGDRFVGIGIHQYNSTDAMYIANYANLSWEGAPSCKIDRGETIDPYYGSSNDICDDFRAEMKIPATVDVDVEGQINDSETEIAVKAFVEPLYDSSNYSLELVAVGDGLSGTTSAWNQSNYYSSSSSAGQPDDIAAFCSGGKYGQGSIVGYVFNDVALSWAGGTQVEALGSLTAGTLREVSCTLPMPTKATLRNAIKKATVYVVALVVDKSTGRIANAAKREVGESSPVGIAAVQTSGTNTVAASYSLGGARQQSLQRGINIVRMADGTVRKVVY